MCCFNKVVIFASLGIEPNSHIVENQLTGTSILALQKQTSGTEEETEVREKKQEKNQTTLKK